MAAEDRLAGADDGDISIHVLNALHDGDDVALLRKSMLTVRGGEAGLRLLRRTGGAAHLLNSFDQIDQAGAEIRILRESAAGRTKGWRAVEPERGSVGERLIGGLAVSLDRVKVCADLTFACREASPQAFLNDASPASRSLPK